MSNLDDLMSFWGEDSKIAKKAIKSNALPKYDLPNVESEEGYNVFESIGTYLIKINSEKIEEQGFIDLDDEWANTKDENIKNHREFAYGEGTLFSVFPKPFCGRKAYLIRVSLESKKTTAEEGIITKKTIRRLSVKDMGNDRKRIMFGGSICVFHNEYLGWNSNAVGNTKKGTNEKGEIVDIPDESGYQYQFATFFGDLALGDAKLFGYVNKKIEADPTINQVMCFGITGYVKKDLKDKDNPPKNPTSMDYWYSMNLDDVFLI